MNTSLYPKKDHYDFLNELISVPSEIDFLKRITNNGLSCDKAGTDSIKSKIASIFTKIVKKLGFNDNTLKLNESDIKICQNAIDKLKEKALGTKNRLVIEKTNVIIDRLIKNVPQLSSSTKKLDLSTLLPAAQKLLDSSNYIQAKLMQNFFLDRYIPVPQELELHKMLEGVPGGVISTTYPNSINGAVVDSSNIDSGTSDLMKAIASCLKDCNTKYTAKYRIDEFKTKPPGSMWIIDVSTNDHGMLLHIFKKDSDNFTLSLYNTGSEIVNHAIAKADTIKNKTKFLTFLSFTDVPLKNLENTAILEELYKSDVQRSLDGQQKKEIKDVYEYFMKLAHGGVRWDITKELTKNRDLLKLYKRHQDSGSCAVQVVAALIRHQILMQNQLIKKNFIQYKISKCLIRHHRWDTLLENCGKPLSPTYVKDAQKEKIIQDFSEHALGRLYWGSRHLFFSNYITDDNVFNEACEIYHRELGITDPLPTQNLSKEEQILYLSDCCKKLFEYWEQKPILTEIAEAKEFILLPAIMAYKDCIREAYRKLDLFKQHEQASTEQTPRNL